MATSFIPQLINQTESKTTKEQVTHERWNELFNLLISQGDHNSNAINTIVGTDFVNVENQIASNDTDIANLFNLHDSQGTLISNLSTLVSDNEDDIEAKVVALKGTGYVNETVKGNAEDLATLDAKVDTNETDIETKMTNLKGIGYTDETVKGNAAALTTHKNSNDHDSRYYTEAEMDSIINTLKGAGWTTENLANLQAQIDNLNDMYSTDSERVAAINAVIADYEAADTNLTTMIENKANQTALDDLAGTGRTTETVKGNFDNLETHKASADHDSRYYTEAEIDGFLGDKADQAFLVNNYLQKTVLATPTTDGFMAAEDKSKIDALSENATFDYTSMNQALIDHKTSADHDGRYYTETEIDNKLSPFDSHIVNSGIHPDVTKILLKDNTTAFTPTADYHPSTKLYTDGKLANIIEDTTPELGGELNAGENSIGFTERANSSSAGVANIDWTMSNKQTITLTEATTLTFANPTKPCNVSLKIVQDATGGWGLTLPTIKWPEASPPAFTTTAGAVDILSLYFDGTKYYGMAGLNFI